MKTRLLAAKELTPEHVEAWSTIQRATPEFDSPYFTPEFTQAVASIRDDVEVAMLEEDGEIVGFFPFQRGKGGIAKPVGGRLSDFQAVIIRPDVSWDPVQILRSCRLKAWHFDHVLLSQEPLRHHHRFVEDSPYVDLTGGFDAYALRHAGRIENPFPNISIKARKLARRVGQLRFVPDTQEPEVLDALITWKIRQYLRSGATNVFAFAWTRALLEQILRCRDESFSGMLSALYAGDRLVAAHFGMRSHGVLHYWFPTYDNAYDTYSPGAIRDLLLMQQVAPRGVQRIDFGKGMDQHKRYFMSGAIGVAVGSVDLRPLTRFMQRQWHCAYSWARSSRLRTPARVPARVFYRVREWFAFQ